MKRYWGLLFAVAFSATAAEKPSVPDEKSLWGNEKNACKELPAASSTRLGLIRQMLATGKPHAAIAYLDASRLDVPQAQLLRADGLRQTGREEEAGRIYRQLLRSCVAGHAYQGLGLSAGNAGKWNDAVTHLKAASAALPIDAAVRNDYGYALMQSGDTATALHEFLTAIELAPNQRRPAHNLILLLSRTGEDAKAAAFAEKVGISAEELAGIQRMALQQGTPLEGTMTGMVGPATPEAAQDMRNETGVSDEQETSLAGGIVAGRNDGSR
jgi:tetratricopeptide (TPR) repeat protein